MNKAITFIFAQIGILVTADVLNEQLVSAGCNSTVAYGITVVLGLAALMAIVLQEKE
ncbi:TPA: hypothetical protein SIA39_004153 [Aeromonas sobria]|nr:hypothetical protein [Aeromonas sobria]